MSEVLPLIYIDQSPVRVQSELWSSQTWFVNRKNTLTFTE